jgi:uncharacterized membrane protein (DUF485 family)
VTNAKYFPVMPAWSFSRKRRPAGVFYFQRQRTGDPANMASPEPLASSSSHARKRLAFILSGIMLVIYMGFILLVAYEKPLLGSQIVPGLSWGILLGVLVIVAAWVITLIYVRWANRNLP